MKSLINLVSAAIPNARAPAANTAAIITLVATASVRHVVDLVTGGYDNTPTAGSLTIACTVQGTAVSQVMPITQGGGFVLRFDPPLQADENTAVTITLAAGGGVVVGKLNAMTR